MLQILAQDLMVSIVVMMICMGYMYLLVKSKYEALLCKTLSTFHPTSLQSVLYILWHGFNGTIGVACTRIYTMPLDSKHTEASFCRIQQTAISIL